MLTVSLTQVLPTRCVPEPQDNCVCCGVEPSVELALPQPLELPPPQATAPDRAAARPNAVALKIKLFMGPPAYLLTDKGTHCPPC